MRKKGDMKCPSCGKAHKGYACGTHKVKGYYNGSLYTEATPQQEQEMMAMAPGVRLQAPMAQPEGPNAMQAAVQGAAMNEALSPVTDYVKDQGSMAFSSAKDLIGGQALGTNAAGAAGQAAQEAAIKSAEAAGKSATEAGLSGIKAGADAATAAQGATQAASGAASSALSGFGGAAAADLLTKGEVDEKTLLKGGLAMGANMLIPGSGFLVGPALSALGLKEGTMEVPPMGYAGGTTIVGMLGDDEGRDKLKELAGGTIVGKALGLADGTDEAPLMGGGPRYISLEDLRRKEEKHRKYKDKQDFKKKRSNNSKKSMGYADGSRYAMQAAEKAKMSPEEIQKKFLEERIVAPAKAFLEERPMMQAPLLLASAARDYERGELPLGKFKGGRLEGGKDRIAYRHKKYGDFEFNPESERVSYKKTFRF